MGMEIGLPRGIVAGRSVMPLVTVDEDLQGSDTPPLVANCAKALQLFHCGVFIDDNHSLFQWRATTNYGHLSRLFVHSLTVFGLHRPTRLFLDHCGYLIVAVGQRGFTEIR